jgi:hypothetical protein
MNFGNRPERGSSQCHYICLLLVIIASSLASGTTPSDPQASPAVAIVDGEAGPCSVEMTVTDVKGNPVAGAKIHVEVNHGFLGLHQTYLEVQTNVEGQGKFIGLPENMDEVLYFHASKDDMRGTAFDSTAKHCHAKHFIVLHKRRHPNSQ